jgi:PAS domain S-box-containing protein
MKMKSSVKPNTAEIRRRAQSRLNERRHETEKMNHYAAIIRSSEDAIIGKNLDGIIMSWNSGAEKIYGYTESEVIGKSISLLIPHGNTDEIPMILDRVRSGEFIEHYETMRRRKDGQIILMSLKISPIRDIGGKIIASSTIGRDITLQKRLEKRIMYLAGLLDDINDAVVASDEQYRLTEWNAAAESLYGWKAEEVLNRNGLEILQTDFNGAEKLQLLKSIDETGYYRGEATQARKDGTRFTADVSSRVLKDENGRVTGYVSINRDITSRKQAEERMKSLLKEKELLVREVHHRVKNNFAVVSSLLGLQSQQIEDEAIQAMFMKSHDRIRSMSLIHERLYQSQELTHINLSEYIRTLVTDLYESYETDPAKVSLIIEAEDVTLNLDQAIPCGLIVNELISNALKYGFPSGWKGEGRVEVTLRRIEKNQIELAVKDNGVGLPIDFDLQKTKSLGLKIINLLAEDQLGGKLRVVKDAGTNFIVRFNITN